MHCVTKRFVAGPISFFTVVTVASVPHALGIPSFGHSSSPSVPLGISSFGHSCQTTLPQFPMDSSWSWNFLFRSPLPDLPVLVPHTAKTACDACLMEKCVPHNCQSAFRMSDLGLPYLTASLVWDVCLLENCPPLHVEHSLGCSFAGQLLVCWTTTPHSCQSALCTSNLVHRLWIPYPSADLVGDACLLENRAPHCCQSAFCMSNLRN